MSPRTLIVRERREGASVSARAGLLLVARIYPVDVFAPCVEKCATSPSISRLRVSARVTWIALSRASRSEKRERGRNAPRALAHRRHARHFDSDWLLFRCDRRSVLRGATSAHARDRWLPGCHTVPRPPRVTAGDGGFFAPLYFTDGTISRQRLPITYILWMN